MTSTAHNTSLDDHCAYDSVGDGMQPTASLSSTKPVREIQRYFVPSGPYSGLWVGTPAGWIRAVDTYGVRYVPCADPTQCPWRNTSTFTVPVYTEPRLDAGRVGTIDPDRSVSILGMKQGGAVEPSGSSTGSDGTSGLCWLRTTAPYQGWTFLGDAAGAVFFVPEPKANSVQSVMWVPIHCTVTSAATVADLNASGSTASGASHQPHHVLSVHRSSSAAGVLSLSRSFRSSGSMNRSMMKRHQLLCGEKGPDGTTGGRRSGGSVSGLSQTLRASDGASVNEPLTASPQLMPNGPPAAGSGLLSSRQQLAPSPAPTPAFSAASGDQRDGTTPSATLLPTSNSALDLGNGFYRCAESPLTKGPSPFPGNGTGSRDNTLSPLQGLPPPPPPVQQAMKPAPNPKVYLQAMQQEDDRTGRIYHLTSVVIDNVRYAFNQDGISMVSIPGFDPSATSVEADDGTGSEDVPVRIIPMGRTALNSTQIAAAVESLKVNKARRGSSAGREMGGGFSSESESDVTAGGGGYIPFVPHSFDAASHNCHHFCDAFLNLLLPQAAGAPSRIPDELTELPTLATGNVPNSLSRRMSHAFMKR